jgi:hypothetical protein
MGPSAEKVRAYRAYAFRLTEERRLRSKQEAVAFVRERGFVFFWPIKDVLMPSLWAAVAGDRPVADAHDDPGHVTWGWKDEMLGTRQWYYAKILRGRATMVSLDVAPAFYALSENYGEPEKDYLQLYQDGLMTREAKVLYETLLRRGPMDTVMLRRAAQMTSRKSDSPFQRALTHLQRDFKILPVGVSQSGGWRYSFIYDTVHRHYPDLPGQAHPLKRSESRERLVSLYFDSVGVATSSDVRKLFQWRARDVRRTLASLVAQERLRRLEDRDGGEGSYVAPALDDASFAL